MYGNLYYKAKSLVRPITQHRRLLERVRYLGIRILPPQEGNDYLARSLARPAAIGKIGSTEMAAIRHFWRHADRNGHCEKWGWQGARLHSNSGVYPPTPEIFSRFCTSYLDVLRHLNVLAVWFNFGEHAAWRRFAPQATLVALRALEPFYHQRPWTGLIAGKRVLVVTPFAATIQQQYQRRREFWRDKPEVLPDFELLTLRVPQSAYVVTPEYPDWFVALDAMRSQMAAMSFDVAIVGAGAWSLPLAVYAKSRGAWAIHLGGATQILFGVKGRAWETHREISAMFNDAWTRPSDAETPQRAHEIEGGRYW
jgi:hypothetical protein